MNVTWKFHRSQLSKKELEVCSIFKSQGIGVIEGLSDEHTKTIFVNVAVMKLFRDFTKTLSHEMLHLISRTCYKGRSATTNRGEETVITSLEFGGYLG